MLTRHLAVAAADPARDGCPGTRHGTASAADRYGCICEDALEARRAQKKARYAAKGRRVPVLGSRRRIRALFAIGHTADTIAAQCPGMTGPIVRNISRGSKLTYVPPEKAATIAAAYEALKGVGGTSPGTASQARRFGYAPPEAWIGYIDDPRVRPWQEPPPPPALDAAALEVDEVLLEQCLRHERDPKEELPGRGLARVTYTVAYLMRPGNTLTSLTRELDCSGTVASECQAWADAVRPALAAKGITRGWACHLAEIGEAVAAERDRLRWQRTMFTAATLASAAGGMHGLVLTAAVEACGKWAAWPYRVTWADLQCAA